MRCREARKRMTAFVSDSLTASERETLGAHLEQCAACARLVEVERLIIGDMEQIRRVALSHPLEVEQVRQRILVRETQHKKTRWGIRIMKQVGDTIYRRPRLSVAVVAVIILMAASVLIPIRTERPVGYEVAFAAPVADLALNPEKAERLLAALNIDHAHVGVSRSDSTVEYKIAPLTDSIKVRRLVAVLDSLGGRRIHSRSAGVDFQGRTIWQLLLTKSDLMDRSQGSDKRETIINLNDILKGDFLLWMPVGDEIGDSVRGLLLDRRGEKTNIQIVGEGGLMAPDDCGWHQYLNNSEMHTQRPDGVDDTFRLYDINDVRRLEKLGYNFATMQWDTPGQMPIPGMGPRLNHVSRDAKGRHISIEFMVPQAYEVSLQILAEDGRVVRTLRDCIMLAGIASLTWDGADDDGEPVGRGKYICRFTAGDYVETKELTLGS